MIRRFTIFCTTHYSFEAFLKNVLVRVWKTWQIVLHSGRNNVGVYDSLTLIDPIRRLPLPSLVIDVHFGFSPDNGAKFWKSIGLLG